MYKIQNALAVKVSYVNDPHCIIKQQTVRKATHVWPCLKIVRWNVFRWRLNKIFSFTDIPIKKSCYADLSSDEKIKCDNTSNPLCYKCSGNRCNNLGRIDQKCLSCSTLTNPNCLQNPKNVQASRCPASISDDAYCFVKSVEKFLFILIFSVTTIANSIGRRFRYSRVSKYTPRNIFLRQ